MPADDYERFVGARERVNNTADAQYVMNGVYLPALAWVLQEADKDQESHEGQRWYRALQARLEGAKLRPFGEETADRLMDAQRLLNLPFPKMPLMVVGDIGDDPS